MCRFGRVLKEARPLFLEGPGRPLLTLFSQKWEARGALEASFDLKDSY